MVGRMNRRTLGVGLVGVGIGCGIGVVSFTCQVTDNTPKKYIRFLDEEEMRKITARHPQVRVLPRDQTQVLFSKIRNKDTTTSEFRHSADRIMRLLIETALNE